MAFKMKGPSGLKKTRAERIRSRKGGNAANVERRLEDGNVKSAAITRRSNVAASKGKTSRAARLRRSADTADDKHWDSLTSAEKAAQNATNKARKEAGPGGKNK